MIRHTSTHFGYPNERERYHYDETLKGYAQIDTRQDAPYFGLWVNPLTRTVVCFCEGDETITTCDTDEELVAEIWGIRSAYGEGFKGIDPGSMPNALSEAFERLGLGSLLH